jgi:ABC-type cobalamin transport system ATPase subunit
MTSPGSLQARVLARVGRLDLDAEIDTAGGTLALVGPNGAGKSTLLSLVLGVLDDGDDEWVKHCGTEKHRAWGELASQFRAQARSGTEDAQTSLEAIFERAQSGPTSPPADAAPGRASVQVSDE